MKRASGRCLDLIRVLRITSWAPLVEAHVQQSQAVLEALRDRPEASRKMLESARVTFEDLGHAVGLLQVEMHAGIVEVLADEPAAAAQHLRRARNGFTALGSHRRAAQATAMLARALLELGEVDEAAELVSESDGGDDLKARIGLLAVRSELSARGGDAAGAEALARQAVELAEGTDALLDHADARLALSRALAAAGREDEALREASTASELYERKGSAVGVRRAGASVAARTSTAITAAASLRRAQPNAATILADKVLATLVSGDVAAAREMYVPDAVYIHHATGQELGRDEHLTVLHQLFGGHPSDISRVVFATSGDRLALSRVTVRTAEEGESGDAADRVGPWALDVVSVAELDGTGRFVRIDAFAPDDLDEALVCFLERLAERTSDPDEARMARAVARALDLAPTCDRATMAGGRSAVQSDCGGRRSPGGRNRTAERPRWMDGVHAAGRLHARRHPIRPGRRARSGCATRPGRSRVSRRRASSGGWCVREPGDPDDFRRSRWFRQLHRHLRRCATRPGAGPLRRARRARVVDSQRPPFRPESRDGGLRRVGRCDACGRQRSARASPSAGHAH